MKKLNDLVSENEKRNESLKIALETVYPIREKLRKDLIKNYSDELLDKISELNKIIDDAEAVVGMSAKEALKWYGDKHPEYVNDDKSINDRGIRRFNIINKKWKKLGFVK